MVSNRSAHVLVWEQPGLEDQRPKKYDGESLGNTTIEHRLEFARIDAVKIVQVPVIHVS